MKQAFGYSLKIWLTTVLMAPFFSNLAQFIWANMINNKFTDVLFLTITEIIVSILFSIISLLGLFLFTYLFIKQPFVESEVKLALSVAALLLIIFPMTWIFDGDSGNSSAVIRFITYPLIAIASVWYYNL